MVATVGQKKLYKILGIYNRKQIRGTWLTQSVDHVTQGFQGCKSESQFGCKTVSGLKKKEREKELDQG